MPIVFCTTCNMYNWYYHCYKPVQYIFLFIIEVLFVIQQLVCHYDIVGCGKKYIPMNPIFLRKCEYYLLSMNQYFYVLLTPCYGMPSWHNLLPDDSCLENYFISNGIPHFCPSKITFDTRPVIITIVQAESDYSISMIRQWIKFC